MVSFSERIRKRAGNKGGFSLAETLLAVLILLLVSVIVATGMPAATNAYNKIVLGANARTMLSTAITALHDEIGTARDVKKVEGKEGITYFNASTGAKAQISLNEDYAIQIQDYMTLSDDLIHDTGAKKGEGHELVSGAGFTPRMYVTYKTIDYSDGIVSIEELKVCRSDNDYVLATFSDASDVFFKIRVISAGFDETETGD